MQCHTTPPHHRPQTGEWLPLWLRAMGPVESQLLTGPSVDARGGSPS
jgi:hypothetical protein